MSNPDPSVPPASTLTSRDLIARGDDILRSASPFDEHTTKMLLQHGYARPIGTPIPADPSVPPASTGEQKAESRKDYCPEMLKPEGCQLHNLHCGYPECNRPPFPAAASTPPPAPAPAQGCTSALSGLEMTMCDEVALVGLIRAAVSQVGTQKAFAQRVGVSEQFLCDVLAGRRSAGPTLAACFGYEPVLRYLRVATALASDPPLVSPPQRQE